MQRVASVAGETIDGPLSSSVRTRLPWLYGQSRDDLPRRGHDCALRVDADSGSRACGVPASGRGTGRNRRDADPDTDRPGNRAWRARRHQRAQAPGPRSRSRRPSTGSGWESWLRSLPIVWKQNTGLGLVLGLAMLGNMLIAGSVGAAVPLFLRRIGWDPAVSAVVVVTTVTDVFGFMLFSRHRKRLYQHDHLGRSPAAEPAGAQSRGRGALTTFCGRPSRKAITFETAPSFSSSMPSGRLVGEVRRQDDLLAGQHGVVPAPAAPDRRRRAPRPQGGRSPGPGSGRPCRSALLCPR